MMSAVSGYRSMLAPTVLFMGFAYSQNIQPAEIVDIKPSSTVQKTNDNFDLRLYIRFAIKENWHINSHEPENPFLFPTILLIDSSADYSCKDIVYPPAKRIKLHLSDSEQALYTGQQIIIAVVSVLKNYRENTISIKGKLQYQACNEENCLMPIKKSFSFIVKIHD
jgi:hypothetical protein